MIDLSAIAKRHGLELTSDGQAIDFAGGRLSLWGDFHLCFVTTIRATSAEAGIAIRRHAATVINWSGETGNMTALIPLRRLNDLILAVREAEAKAEREAEVVS